MKRFLLLAALPIAAAACESPSNDGTTEPTTSAADPGSVTRTPDALGATPSDKDLDEDHGIFVSTAGKDTAPGTRDAPFATLQAAMTAAAKVKKIIYACEGTYNEALEIVNGVHMVGGIVCANGLWKFGTARSKIAAPTSPVMHAKDVTALTRIEGFEVVAPNGNETSTSSIGLIAESSKGLVFANMRIAAGRGFDGVDGTNGTQLALIDPGAGSALYPTPSYCANIAACGPRAGGSGGITSCDGAPGFSPGVGGTGGSSGLWHYNNTWAWDRIGFPPTGAAVEGSPGQDGASGTNGAFTPTGYVLGDGTSGTNGGTGTGGRGGDGVTPAAYNGAMFVNMSYWGVEGGGGGGGGCPGLAGTPGTGGGASVAALLFDSAISITASELVSADGGAGGHGTLGSSATPGGAGGVTIVAGAAGQNGGAGGRAGISGHGSGGPSHAIAYHGTAPTMDDATKLTVGNGGLGRDAVTVGDGGNVRTIPASTSGEASSIHSF